MRIFVLFDQKFPAYPMLGLYTTLEKAFAAAWEDGPPTPNLCVWEEETDLVYDDPKNPPFEPIFHEIPKEKPT